MTFRKGKIKIFKRDKTSLLAGFAAILFIASIGVHILFGSHAAVPLTPTLSNVCGATNASDIEQSTINLTPPETAITKAVVPSGGLRMATFHMVNVGGTEYAYSLNDNNENRTVSVYNLSSQALVSSFHVAMDGNTGDNYAVDPSGEIYVGNANNQTDQIGIYKYSQSGNLIWYKNTGSIPNNVYGYTAANGTWYAAYRISTSSGPIYDQTGQSAVYDQSGTAQANNNMDIPGDSEQDPTSEDIISTGDNIRVMECNHSIVAADI
jgi:hypothetical protein